MLFCSNVHVLNMGVKLSLLEKLIRETQNMFMIVIMCPLNGMGY